MHFLNSSVIYFMCPFDLAKGCPDSWLTYYLSVSVRMFLEELAFELVDFKDNNSSICVVIIQSIEGRMEQKSREKMN